MNLNFLLISLSATLIPLNFGYTFACSPGNIVIKVTIIQLKTRKDHETMGYSSSQAARHKQSSKCMTECLQFTESYKYSQKLKIRLWVIGKQSIEYYCWLTNISFIFQLHFSTEKTTLHSLQCSGIPYVLQIAVKSTLYC